jgi:hypothetical protein
VCENYCHFKERTDIGGVQRNFGHRGEKCLHIFGEIFIRERGHIDLDMGGIIILKWIL